MILSDSITPAQLTAFKGIVDLYRDQYGRTIARQWPHTPTTVHRNTLKTAALIAPMHANIKNAPREWHTTFDTVRLPTGRSPEDLKRQTVLWLMRLTPTPPLYGLSFLSRTDNLNTSTSTTVLSLSSSTPHDPTNTTFAFYHSPNLDDVLIHWNYTNQLFRRNTPTLKRPVEIITKPAFSMAPTSTTPTTLTFVTPLLSSFATIRPFWTTGTPTKQSTANSSCYPPPPWPIPITPPIPIYPPITIHADYGFAWSQLRDNGGIGVTYILTNTGQAESSIITSSNRELGVTFLAEPRHIRITWISTIPNPTLPDPPPLAAKLSIHAPYDPSPNIRQGWYPIGTQSLGILTGPGDSASTEFVSQSAGNLWITLTPTVPNVLPVTRFKSIWWRIESFTD